jgi:hypothetical protein
MGQVIPRQHPAVVLRRQYKAVLAMLCVALVAVVALAATVVILADDDIDTKVSVAPKSAQVLQPGTRFDGGPDEGTRGIQPQTLPPGTRFDGGPDEGTRGPQAHSQWSSPLSTYQADDETPSSSQAHPGARP